ncbi:MAG: discoidin domain-containing protein, partial [Marinilabiliaceae bacterium]|nr:discoidin domain-containing protein [Marinilabiliaceae bacterium]
FTPSKYHVISRLCELLVVSLGRWLIVYQYRIDYSTNRKDWKVIRDLSEGGKDAPHEYIPLDNAINARYIRMTVLNVPDGTVAVSGFRIFGKGNGQVPGKVNGLIVERDYQDERKVTVRWQPESNAQGYVLRYGIKKDKLYHSVMLYDQNDISLNCLNKGVDYFFAVEAFNENGVAKPGEIVACKTAM